VAKLLMTLSEALEVRSKVFRAKSKKMICGLPPEVINLAGATVSFCGITGRKALHRNSVEVMHKDLKAEWIDNGRSLKSEIFVRMIAAEKILENWKETEDWDDWGDGPEIMT